MKIKKYSINSKNLIFLSTACIKSSKIAENIEDFAAKILLTYTTIFKKTDENGEYMTNIWHSLAKKATRPVTQRNVRKLSAEGQPRRCFIVVVCGY